MITRIGIKNFRSLVACDISTKDLTVLVGPNDSGKSNILRALNLFFNGELEPGRRLNFEADFSGHARRVKGKAPEIIVELTLSPPSSYKERRSITWRKVWRSSSTDSYLSKRKFTDGSEISGRNKVGVWLDRLRFEYVPAIKSPDYFVRLLRELHDTFADTIDADLRAASSGFVSNIHKHTKSMSRRLQGALGFSSEVELPGNLGSLFEVLEFQTDEGGSLVPLSSRGDGVKVRHIPVVLKFIAEQRNINASSGHIRSDTIWGYEEPENNLELAKAYELRDEFLSYSSDTQIILTTHSPAFYGICEVADNISSSRHFVSKGGEGTKIEDSAAGGAVSNLDRQLGLLPLVEPHIREALEEARRLRANMLAAQKYLPHPSDASVFVEGLTDKTVLEALLKGQISGHQIKATSSGGANWVADCLLATVALGSKVGHSIGVLDGDRAGEDAARRVDEVAAAIRKTPSNISKVRLSKIKPGSALMELRKKGLKIPVALEELASDEAWGVAEEKGWLEDRPDLLHYNEWKDPTVSFFSHCGKLGLSVEALRLLKFRVALVHKQDFASYVVAEIENGLDDKCGLVALKSALIYQLAE